MGYDRASHGSFLLRDTICTSCGERAQRPVRTLATSLPEWEEIMSRGDQPCLAKRQGSSGD